MSRNLRSQIVDIIETHKTMVAQLQVSGLETIAAAAEVIIRALKKNGTVYICGNGGSAADAQHIAGELVGRFECNRRALSAVALTTDSSVITSIANDDSYEAVFARQAEALVRKGDVFWVISTSGSSPNVMAAVRVAKRRGALVLAFTGRKNSSLERLADICLCADNKSTARSQEIHQLAYHIICKLVEQSFT
ncbi:MAG: SIS domain-containing protein [Sedimentisphaerales bacterium]|jgi:D-sedoheptulose 7-phosphate isomerase